MAILPFLTGPALGEFPLLHPKHLPQNGAQTAKNCNLESGGIEAMKSISSVQSIAKTGTIKTIFLMDTTWIYWTSILNIVEAPVANSDFRIFYTGDSYPKQTNKTKALSGSASSYPTITRRFGVYKPDYVSESTLAAEVLGTAGEAIKRKVTYFYTVVDEFDCESEPSEETAVFDLYEGQYVRLRNFVSHNLSATGNDIKYFRLYRVTTGTDGSADWRMVEARPGSLSGTPVYDIPVSIVSGINVYVYDANDSVSPTDVDMELGEVCPSEGCAKLPDDAKGLIEYQHATLAAYVDNVIYISEPLYYHAFPYEKKVGHNVVALGAFNEALIVGTEGYPYMFIGTDPANLTRIKLPYKKPCLAERGAVSTPNGFIYPTTDGLFFTNGSDAEIITKGIFSETDWKSYTTADIIGAFYNNQYIAFFYGSDTGFIIDLSGNNRGKIQFDLPYAVYGKFVSPNGTLYIICYNGGTYYVYQWLGGSNLSWEWESKIYETVPTNFPFVKLVGEFSGSVTAYVYGDGSLLRTASFTETEVQRLPSGTRYRDWKIKLSGTNSVVTKAVLGTSQEEMRQIY